MNALHRLPTAITAIVRKELQQICGLCCWWGALDPIPWGGYGAAAGVLRGREKRWGSCPLGEQAENMPLTHSVWTLYRDD